MEGIGKISEAELEVMKILWDAEENAGGDSGIQFSGVGTSEVVKRLQANKGWERSTIRTLLKRLCEKEAVISEKQTAPSGRQAVFLHRAAVAEEAFRKAQTRGFIDRLYGGSAKELVAALVDNKALSREDLRELRAFFEEQ